MSPIFVILLKGFTNFLTFYYKIFLKKSKVKKKTSLVNPTFTKFSIFCTFVVPVFPYSFSLCFHALVLTFWTMLAQSWCILGPKLLHSWCKVGEFLVQSWCILGAKLVHTWCKVGAFLVQSWCILGAKLKPHNKMNAFLSQNVTHDDMLHCKTYVNKYTRRSTSKHSS